MLTCVPRLLHLLFSVLLLGGALGCVAPAWGQPEVDQEALVPPAAMVSTSPDAVPPFVTRTWTVRDGLPLNVVWSLAQTSDGALWAGTLDGLARFDGHSFTTFSGARTPGLAGNRVVALHATGDELWVGTQTGLSVGRQSQFQQVEGPGHVENIGEGSDGTVWIAGHPGLYRTVARPPSASETRVERIALPDSLPRRNADDVEPVRSDSIFVAVDGRLLFYQNGRFRPWRSRLPHLAARLTGPVRRLATSPDGQLWVATENEIVVVGNSTASRYPHDGGRVFSIRFAPDGAAWVTTPERGLLRVSASGIAPIEANGALPTTTRGLVRDHTGQWWVGTHDRGLIRLQRRLFHYPESDWNDGIGAHAIYADDRSVWTSIARHGVCRYQMLPRFEPGRGDTAEARSREPWPPPNLKRRCFSSVDGLPGLQIWGIQRDGSGALWIATSNHLVRRRDGRFETVRDPNGNPFRGTSVLHRGPDGNLWIATAENGVYRREDGEFVSVLAPTETRSRIQALHHDQTGALWIGTQSHGIARRTNGTLRWYDSDDGVPYHNIRDVYETEDGAIWISTQGGGIARFEGDARFGGDPPKGLSFTPVTPEDGLPHRSIHLIREAPEGMFWMTSNGGIFRVPRRQLQAVADGTQDRLSAQVFQEDDGMRTRECNGNVQPIFGRDAQGRFWTATVAGPVVFDPHDPAFAVPDSIPVRITAVRADGVSRSLDTLRLAPSTYRLAVDFTAISLRYADDLSFRYRIDEGPWTHARSRRTAEYTGLEAGAHRFEVQATVNGTTWHALDVPLRVTIEPHVYQTWWFRLLAGLFVLGLAAAGYRWRMRQIQKRQSELESLVDERTRELAEEKRRTEKQAEKLSELDQAKSRFFAHVSHEFRTPLSLILGPLQDAVRGDETLDPASMRRMLHNARRLQGLIDQLLDLAALEEGGMSLALRHGDLAAFVERTVDAFRSEAQRRDIDLSVDREPSSSDHTGEASDGIPMQFDPNKVETILTNLLANALAFTPDGGSVTVRLRRDALPAAPQREKEERSGAQGEDGVQTVHGARQGNEGEAEAICISVVDTGPGIAEEDLDGVFDRFTQVSTAATTASRETSRNHGARSKPDEHQAPNQDPASSDDGSEGRIGHKTPEGLGLGLALTRELAQLHGGAVQAESTPGEGSTFRVWLPIRPVSDALDADDASTRQAAVRPEASRPATDRPPTDRLSPGDGSADRTVSRGTPPQRLSVRTTEATIMVVEDNPEMRAFLTRRLGEIWSVRSAANGKEAWQDLQREAPDLLLSDVMMPDPDGFELCRKVKSDPALRVVPVILLTARTSDHDTVEGLKSGADDYVAKPFDLAELIRRIDNHLAARRHARAHHQDTIHLDALGQTVDDADAAFMREVMATIDEHLGNPDFTTEQLAQAVALSRRQFSRRLKDAIGETPAAFVRTCRIERAKSLLENGPDTIAEVAYAVGFRSSSHFSQAFKDEVGCTPSTYVDQQTAS